MLSWIAAPKLPQWADFDSHMVSNTMACEAYYANTLCQNSQHKYTLDHDVTTWAGPETITITESYGQTGLLYDSLCVH